jgi:hypothetical protein
MSDKNIEILSDKMAKLHDGMKSALNRITFPNGREQTFDELDRLTNINRIFENPKSMRKV